jgi:uncharacterized protein YoaH (UPF0181 family)
MANFVPGDANPIAEIKPWSPDWSFLSQVYGVTQARFDKGFNQVKSLYNSVLNSPLTNGDNQKFRQDMFEKIQGSLRNVSALDLSDPSNVMRAQSLLDPITDDKEIAYDMYFTKYEGNQKALMDSYKNSTDAKVRAQYSDYAKLDLMFAEDDLRQAKRGDGSITSVQPRDFTPFEDINEYLSGAAKEAKLQVKFANPDGKGYIMTYTNGKYAEVPFSNWAAMTMGNRFDRQFGVIGRVTAENQIRDLIGQGMSREQATQQVAKSISADYMKSQQTDVEATAVSLTDAESQLQTIRDLYPQGIPSGKKDVMAKYQNLLKLETELRNNKVQSEGEIKKIEEDPENYTISNLYGILSGQAKKNAATVWGVSTAQATAELDVKPDQKVISDFDRAAANARHAATLAQNERHFQQNQQMELAKMQNANEIEMMKLKAEGKLPTETYVGDYVGTGSTGVDVLGTANSKNKTELFNNAFGAQNGLINMVIGKNRDHSKYYQVLSKVQGIAQGNGAKLTAQDTQLLKEYGSLVGYRRGIDVNSASSAGALIQTLASNTYNKATQVLQWYSDNGKTSEGRKYAQSFEGTITSMKGILQEQKELDKSYREVASKVYDFRSGKVKSDYAGAKIVSRLADGTPIFDLSGLSEAKRKHLSTVVGSEFSSRANPIGSTYSMTKPQPEELYQFFNKADKNIVITRSNGEKIDPSLIGNLPYASQVKLFGESFLASFDPGGKSVYVDLKVNPDSGEAKSMKLQAGETIRVKLPYSYIQNSPLTRFKNYLPNNSIVADSYGIMEDFSRNPMARVQAPASMTATGFDFTAAGVRNNNGQYGVNIDFTMLNPQKGVKEGTSRFFQVDPNDPSQFMQISEMVNTTWTNFQNATSIWEEQFDQQDLLQYPTIEY